MKWIAQLIANPTRFAVTPDDGDSEAFTTSPELAYNWRTRGECRKWIDAQAPGVWKPLTIL